MTYTRITLMAAALLVGACSSGNGGGDGPPPAPANAAPKLATIADQDTPANQTGRPITVDVTDEDAATVQLTAMSDDERVVAATGLDLSGTGRARTLVVTPVDDTVGEVTITVVATDAQGLSSGESFRLSVEAEQRSIQQFVRSGFMQAADDDPELINAVDFAQDAGEDDFTDLLSQ